MSVYCIWCRDNLKFKLHMYHASSNKLRKKRFSKQPWCDHSFCTHVPRQLISLGFGFLQIFSSSVRLDYEALHWSLIEFILHFILPPKDTHTVSLEADLIFCPDCVMPFWVVNWIFRTTAINARQVSHLWPMPFMCSQWMWPHIKHRGVCFHICHALIFTLILFQTTQHKVTLWWTLEVLVFSASTSTVSFHTQKTSSHSFTLELSKKFSIKFRVIWTGTKISRVSILSWNELAGTDWWQKMFSAWICLQWLFCLFFSAQSVEVTISLTSGWFRLHQSLPEPIQRVPTLEAPSLRSSHAGGRPEDCIWSQGPEWGRISGMFVLCVIASFKKKCSHLSEWTKYLWFNANFTFGSELLWMSKEWVQHITRCTSQLRFTLRTVLVH